MTPKTTLRPTLPSTSGYSFESEEEAEAPGTQLANIITSSYLRSGHSPGRPTTRSRYLSDLGALLVEELLLDHGDARVVLARAGRGHQPSTDASSAVWRTSRMT